MVVDGGNLLFHKRRLNASEREQLTYKARVIVEAYNRMGVAAVAVGPYDFAAGYDALREFSELATFPFLCANLLNRDTGATLFPPYRIIDLEGTRVGILGVMDSSTDLTELGLEKRCRLEPLYSSVRRYSEDLKAQGCDVVLVISSADPKKFRVLAKNIEAVDLYVSGDPDDKLQIPWAIGSAMVAHTSQLGKYVGHATITPKAEGGSDIDNRFTAMKPEYWDDPTVKRLVDTYYKVAALAKVSDPASYVKEEEQAVNVKYGRPAFVSSVECGRCHEAQFRAWLETPHAAALEALPPEHRRRVECLECHVTGFGEWSGFSEGEATDLSGVQCEACHGAGSLHPAKPIAKPGKSAEDVCRRCHTRSRSPDFKPARYLARIACSQVESEDGVTATEYRRRLLGEE